jgi:hypothetical protein
MMRRPRLLLRGQVFGLAFAVLCLVHAGFMDAAARADEASPALAMPEPSSASDDWGGWYLGGHTGYAHGKARSTLSNAVAPNTSSSFGSLDGGALIGYSVQRPSRLVLGLGSRCFLSQLSR